MACRQSASDSDAYDRPRDDDDERRRFDKARADQLRNKMLALQLWEQARDPRGTPAEKYLERRGLALPPSTAVSVIRYLENSARGISRLHSWR